MGLTRKEKTNHKSDSKMALPPQPTRKASAKPSRSAVETPVELQMEMGAQPTAAPGVQKPDRKAKKGAVSKATALKTGETKSSETKAGAAKNPVGMHKTMLAPTTTPLQKTLPPPKPAERRFDALQPPLTVQPTLPRTPHDIPGLGPIRVRALQKAGLESLAALHAAPLERLAMVPGMSPIKAQQIKTFLAALPEIPPALPGAAKQEKKPSPVLPARLVEAEEAWEHAARSTAEQAVALLINPFAPVYRANLLRELVRYASRMPGWLNSFGTQTERDRDRAVRRMHRIGELLTEASAQPDLDRKTQTRLSEDLSDASDRLDALTEIDTPASREKAGGDET